MTKKGTVSKAVKDYLKRIGRKGASLGGRARMATLSATERTALAKRAAAARWGGR
jgi:hypothetical protein